MLPIALPVRDRPAPTTEVPASHDLEIAEKVRHLSPEELALHRIRHSLAHVLAAAITELHPGTALGFGPPVADGFYYDFLLPGPLSEGDLPAIEARMRELLARDEPFVGERLGWDEARERVQAMEQPFVSPRPITS